MFKDRVDAGRRLAKKLNKYKNKKDVLILGIPRGGVLVAYEVAKAIKAPLDVLIIKKVGAPDDEELAIGAAGMDTYYLNEDLSFDVPKEYLDTQIKLKQKEARERYVFLKGKRKRRSLKQKIVILIDDGIATGATMQLAVRMTKQQGAKKVIVATPVAPPRAVQALLHTADEVVCLEQPECFLAIGQQYKDFRQIEIEGVKTLLA